MYLVSKQSKPLKHNGFDYLLIYPKALKLRKRLGYVGCVENRVLEEEKLKLKAIQYYVTKWYYLLRQNNQK